jgi:signal transduction histidine kinase
VRGVKFQLMRVFQNLLKNAMEAGATRISILLAQGEQGPLVTLADNGKGMTPEEREKVEKGNYTSKVGGMGLGMNICRHILSAHGAGFDLKSEHGVGSTISMQFPKSFL